MVSKQFDNGEAAFVVEVICELQDADDEVVATIAVRNVAVYTLVDNFVPSEDDIEYFLQNGVLFQVHPYARETISSLASRAGLPGAFLPVLVKNVADE
ncbi:hypothetical protein [Nocardioides dongxiaopingii]|uniref:hypothetical protein n=1 Tax=Nocardioides dongxiaopingii TaxID=2576036 RepID=UPI001484DDC2|nr:hypothetical protein [Nocardioides dongxiaopingii]